MLENIAIYLINLLYFRHIKPITAIYDRTKYNQFALVNPKLGTVAVVFVDTKNLTVVPYDANLIIYNIYGTV